MTKEEMKAYFCGASPKTQTSLLAGLAHEMTLIARASYSTGPDGQTAPAATMIAVNELQHLISSHLWHLADEDKDRYPDDVLMNILFEKAEVESLKQEFVRGFERVVTRIQDWR